MNNIVNIKEKIIDVTIMGRITVKFNAVDYFNKLEDAITFNKLIGGSSGNIAIYLKKMGKSVNFISRISSDAMGKYLLNSLEKNEIVTKQIQIDSLHRTGLSFVEMSSEYERKTLMYREKVADLEIDKSVIDYDLIENSKVCVISGFSLSKEPSRSACLEVVKVANRVNSTCIFDLDYRPYSWKNKNDISRIYRIVANKSNVLIGTEFELRFLFQERDEENELKVLFKWYLENTEVNMIILKQGMSGATIYTKKEIVGIKIPDFEKFKVIHDQNIFTASVIDSIIEKQDLKDILTKAVWNLLIVNSKADTSTVEITPEVLNKFKKDNPIKLEIVKDKW